MTVLLHEPTIHPSTVVTNSSLGAWTDIGEQTENIFSTIGDYSYFCDRCHVMYAAVGNSAPWPTKPA
ncbi:hypothetical protein DSECCO2_404410 [anaerobic digester metagenome]